MTIAPADGCQLFTLTFRVLLVLLVTRTASLFNGTATPVEVVMEMYAIKSCPSPAPRVHEATEPSNATRPNSSNAPVLNLHDADASGYERLWT